jgi:predicted nucleic acid-binding protein
MSSRRDDHVSAIKLLQYLTSKNYKFTVSTLSLANADYLLGRHYNVNDFNKRFIKLKKFYHIASMTESQAEIALLNDWKDFEDALQYQSAIGANCEAIITRDQKGFNQSIIPIYTPEQFLEEQNHAT